MDTKRKKNITLSVVLAVYNEELNLTRCLESVQAIADEIVVVDGGSTDSTIEIAKRFNATVYETTNPAIFHINKQKALDAARGAWILQLDADEEVSGGLAREILGVVSLTDREIDSRIFEKKKRSLFTRHQEIIRRRDGVVGTEKGEIAAFFVARRNNFLGKYLRYAGTYPDGVIRLVKHGSAYFPCKSVHEQIVVQGRVSWLEHDLLHHSNSTLAIYVKGANKYTDLVAREIRQNGSTRGLYGMIQYICIKPLVTFIRLYIRHKGILDGWRGFLFSVFSSLHFPVAYLKYVSS